MFIFSKPIISMFLEVFTIFISIYEDLTVALLNVTCLKPVYCEVCRYPLAGPMFNENI